MNYNITDRVRKVLVLAREEAIGLQHDYVGTVHVLLGLIREGEGVAVTALMNLKVDVQQLRRRVYESIGKGEAPVTAGELAYTSRAQTVLASAQAEALRLNHEYIGTEHLLLGLLREERGIAAQVLATAGVAFDSARDEILRIINADAIDIG
jgi:ATP-dependent Clp protease ATP-binding subunit ClpC